MDCVESVHAVSLWFLITFYSLLLPASVTMTAEPPSKKQKSSGSVTTPFQPQHELMYGVKPCDHGPRSVVLGVRCHFCVAFSREKKASQTLCIFKPPYRPQNYRSYIESQHAQKSALYQSLSDAEKKTFFDVP